MKRIVFGETLNNDEMVAVISALIMRRNQLKDFIDDIESGSLFIAYNKEIETIKAVLDKIHIEG